MRNSNHESASQPLSPVCLTRSAGGPARPARFPARTALFSALALCAALIVDPAAAAKKEATPAAVQDQSYALVQLNGEPLASYERTKPPKGKKIDFASNTARSYRAQLSKMRNEYKAWLRKNVPGAKVTGEFDISLNAVAVKLNGATLDQVSSTPMVRMAQYQGLYYRNQADPVDPDLALILAEQAWSEGGGAPGAGKGVRVAIVDSGIDITHPCFDDDDYPDQKTVGDRRYTNNKVIAARVFNNQLNRSGFDAEAVDSHGTHVAGTVACNYQTPATVDDVVIPYGISGVAPAALLGNYNVFPGDVASARSEDILNALDAAYADGFDVANMSLGGGSNGVQDLLTVAVDNLDQANMVVAISNGNEGPGYFTVGSPGMAERGLTAGASSVPHFIGAPVTTGDYQYGAASGDFPTVSGNLISYLGVVEVVDDEGNKSLSEACTALTDHLAGTIALISRGSCSFSTKIRNAAAAGADAVLVVNNVAGDPTAMGEDGSPNQPTVPAYMVSLSEVDALIAADGAATTIGYELSYIPSSNANIMAGFSSQGPTDVRFRVKPDVVAPGVNVLSSVPANACEEESCFAFFSGTSMAAPHLAGSAAVILGQHPGWSAAEVRSAVVNTAQRDVLLDYQTGKKNVDDVNIVGAGLENLEAAVNAAVALDPVSLAFGGVPSGSGQTRTLDMIVTNLGGQYDIFELSISGQPEGVSYSVSPAELALDDGESAVVQVTMTASRGAFGMQQAYLEVAGCNGGMDCQPAAHAALLTLMK